jgi:glycosyltransferase involved in cell wall biosynthesis
MKKTITTIIPTYRRPVFLKKAIESILSQTYSDFQICVYDNASGDETEKVVRSLMKVDPRIKYHRHPENIGMMANYQYAFSKIDTPYFSFLSDDDYFLPIFYETAMRGFQNHPDAAFSACGVKAIDEMGKLVSNPLSVWNKEGYFTPPQGITEMIDKPLLPNGILFQTNLVKNIELDPSKEIQIRWDTDYLLQIAARFPFVINKRVCAIFLSHSEGYSTSHYRQMHNSSKKFFEHLVATDKIKERLFSNTELPSHLKNKAEAAFYRDFKRQLCSQVRNYSYLKMFPEAKSLLSIVQKRYGFKPIFLASHLKLWIFENAKWAVPYARRMLIIKNQLSHALHRMLLKKD